jgi:hypothetical protein
MAPNYTADDDRNLRPRCFGAGVPTTSGAGGLVAGWRAGRPIPNRAPKASLPPHRVVHDDGQAPFTEFLWVTSECTTSRKPRLADAGSPEVSTTRSSRLFARCQAARFPRARRRRFLRAQRLEPYLPRRFRPTGARRSQVGEALARCYGPRYLRSKSPPICRRVDSATAVRRRADDPALVRRAQPIRIAGRRFRTS